MYELNTKNMKKGYRFYGMFLLVGILFWVIIGGVMLQRVLRRVEMDSEVKAYDVKINKKYSSEDELLYYPTYYYEVDGQKYTYSLAYSTNVGVSKMEKENTIYYKSSNPQECVSEYETKMSGWYILAMLFIGVFVVAGFLGIRGVRKNIKRVKWLAENGTLIQGLPYHLVDTGNRVNNRSIYAIEVEYKLPSGSVITLVGDPRYDKQTQDEDGLVDLLIDPNDPDNYYIDFQIQ